MSLGDAAAKLGFPVFPCGPNKRPVVESGFKAAVTDPTAIRAMFARPGAEMIGVPTGEVSNMVVIDIDVRDDRSGMVWLKENEDFIPDTRRHTTRSGGLHLVFLYPTGFDIRNSAGKIAPGVDVRGNGGYVIVPPSPGYAIAEASEPVEMPRWLITACMKPEVERAPAPPSSAQQRKDGGTKYGLAGLTNESNAIRNAQPGTKHHTLNRAAYSIGGLVASGELDHGPAMSELRDALNAIKSSCEDFAAAERTLAEAFAAGVAAPRAAPPRKERIASPPPDDVPPHDYYDQPQDEDAYYAALDQMSADEWRELEQREGGQPVPASDDAKKAAGKNLLWSVTKPWAETDIPARPWIAKGYLLRGSVSVVSGPGSAGKSSLMVAWAAVLSLSAAFGPFRPVGPMKVATYNVEDDEQEQKRRFSAMARELGLDVAQVMANLSILGPSGIGTLLRMSGDGRLLVNTPVMDELDAWVADHRPDVLILDPFVELHAEEENDNTAIRAVMARFRAWAATYKMAVVILHHARKGLATPGDPDSLRGASAIVGAARVALTVNVMTEEEAEAASISKEHRRDYFRLDGAKQNYAPIEDAEWFQRKVHTLDNGDAVAVAWPWKLPTVWKDMTPNDIEAVFQRIEAGPSPGLQYAPTNRGAANTRWVGNVVMQLLGLTETQAGQVVRTWFKNGVLVETGYRDPSSRKEVKGVMVDRSKSP